MNATDNTLCGARRPGWERPGPGRHRLPCVREGHEGDGDHRNAIGETWPASCQDCGATDGPLDGLTLCDADGSVRDGHLCGPCTVAATAPETVDQVPEVPAARPPVRMCVRCCVITDAPVVVSEVHAASGPGFNVYACPPCAPHFPRLPDALDLLKTGSQRRTWDGR